MGTVKIDKKIPYGTPVYNMSECQIGETRNCINGLVTILLWNDKWAKDILKGKQKFSIGYMKS